MCLGWEQMSYENIEIEVSAESSVQLEMEKGVDGKTVEVVSEKTI